MRNLKNKLISCGSFLTGVVGHHYMSKLLDYRIELAASTAGRETELKDIAAQQNIEALHKKLDFLQERTENMLEPLSKLADKYVPEVQLIAIKEKMEFGAKHCKTVKEILDKGPDNFNLEYYRAAYIAVEACERANSEAYTEVKILVDSLNVQKSLVFNLNLDSFYVYLNSLSLFELSALYHLIVLTVICINLLNILSVVLGNEMIKYFKLEERFPKLAVFLRLRLKFQKYYLILSFFLIFFISFASILMNIFVLY